MEINGSKLIYYYMFLGGAGDGEGLMRSLSPNESSRHFKTSRSQLVGRGAASMGSQVQGQDLATSRQVREVVRLRQLRSTASNAK